MKKQLILQKTCSVVCLLLLLFVAGCTGSQSKPKDAQQAAKAAVPGSTLLATISEKVSPPPIVPGHEADPASKGQPATFPLVFSEAGNSVAYLAWNADRFFVVYNQSPGKEYSAVGTIVLSPDGRRLAYCAQVGGKDSKWSMVVDGKEGKQFDTILTPYFSPDSKHVLYLAKEAAKWHIVLDGLQNEGTLASYSAPVFSSDSSLIAFVEAAASIRDEQLFITDLSFRKLCVRASIGDDLPVVSKDKRRFAVVEAFKNKFRVIDLNFSRPDVIHEGPLFDLVEQVSLSDDGASLTYCALNGRDRLIRLDNREEILPSGRSPEMPVIRPDKKGVGILLAENNQISLHHCFVNNTEKGKIYDEAAALSYSKEGSSVYTARTGNNWFIVVNSKEGPAFDKVVEPMFSPDGKYVAYRARKDGKRFVVIADTSAKTVKTHPSYEQVSGVQFTPDGKAVAYGVKDGKQLLWKVVPL